MRGPKVILIGHPGSQFLVPASKYLTGKYLPGFNVQYLNHRGPTEEWSKFLCEQLRFCGGTVVILSLDDYLLSAPIDMEAYEQAMSRFMEDGVRCVKLFECTDDEHLEYPVTTQYTVWDRRFLMKILQQTTDPWDFEMKGSRIFGSDRESVSVKPAIPALKYNTSSALSSRWKGVRLDGLSEEDRAEVQKLIEK